MNTPRTMNTLKIQIKRWEGVASVIWALLGYAFTRYWADHFGFLSLYSVFFIVIVSWWGVSLLLAFSGLRSGLKIGVIPGLVTVLGFLCFLLRFFWPVIFHR